MSRFVVVFCLTLLLAPSFTFGATDDLRARVASLEALVSEPRLELEQKPLSSSPRIAKIRFERLLEVGATGEDVRHLQVVLNADPDTIVAFSGVGSRGKETSSFGPLTSSALIKFQRKYDLPETGALDSLTRITLNGLIFSAGTKVATKPTSPPVGFVPRPVGSPSDVTTMSPKDITALIEENELIFSEPIPEAAKSGSGFEAGARGSSVVSDSFARTLGQAGENVLNDYRFFKPFAGKTTASVKWCNCINPAYFPHILLVTAPIVTVETSEGAKGKIVTDTKHLAFFPNVTNLIGLDILSNSYKYHLWFVRGVNTVGTYTDLVRLTCFKQITAPPYACRPDTTVGQIDGMIKTIGTSLPDIRNINVPGIDF